MGIEEGDDKPINLLEVQSEVTEEEPIEQVLSQEPEDVKTVEPTVDLEDQERFEETAKFEEVDIPKVESKPVQKQARKLRVTRKSPTRVESQDKPISKLHDEVRKHSDARKKTEREILDTRKELKDVLLVHHATINFKNK